MPTSAHEIPIFIFRKDPERLLQYLGDALLASRVSYDRIEDKSNDLSQLLPVALRADLVLVFYQGERPVMVLVVEVQRAPDADKLRSWPGYVGELVFRYGCPVYLVVIAGDEETAQWASEPNPFFQLNSPFLPLVLAPHDIPLVTTPEEAALSAEVTLLSLSVHIKGPHGVDVAAAALEVAHRLGKEYKVMIVTLLMQQLDKKTRDSLKSRIGMDLNEWLRDNESEVIRAATLAGKELGEELGEKRGEKRGKAEGILLILQARGVSVPEALRQRMLSCKDPETLDRWLVRAALAQNADELLAEVAR